LESLNDIQKGVTYTCNTVQQRVKLEPWSISTWKKTN